MKNVYHSDIMAILLKQGSEGMRPCRLAKRIFNLHNGLFAHNVDYEDIHRSIANYLWRESRRRGGPFLRLRYGVYAIKPDLALQLDIFLDAVPCEPRREEEHKHKVPAPDLQLYLDF